MLGSPYYFLVLVQACLGIVKRLFAVPVAHGAQRVYPKGWRYLLWLPGSVFWLLSCSLCLVGIDLSLWVAPEKSCLTSIFFLFDHLSCVRWFEMLPFEEAYMSLLEKLSRLNGSSTVRILAFTVTGHLARYKYEGVSSTLISENVL